jgi:hypothetical protein
VNGVRLETPGRCHADDVGDVVHCCPDGGRFALVEVSVPSEVTLVVGDGHAVQIRLIVRTADVE